MVLVHKTNHTAD